MSITEQQQSTSELPEKNLCNPRCRLLAIIDSRQLLLLSIFLFMIIAGARLLVLKHFGSDIPLWDQWSAEGAGIYKHFFDGTLKLEDFFAAHNEHRILFTRLLSLGLFLLNGLWDMRLQTVVNAIIYAIVGTGLFWLVGGHISRLQRVVWVAATALIFSLPYGWENALWGFQSQIYFLVGFSLLVLYVSWPEDYHPVKWGVLLLLVQLSALFTMGSGVLAPLTILFVQLLAMLRNRGEEAGSSKVRLRVVITGVVVLAGFMLIEHVAAHDGHRAASLATLLFVFAHSASWPNLESGFWWAISWLPFALLGVLFLLRQTNDRQLTRFALSFGIWVLLQDLATAYARNGIAFRSKYSDVSALCLLVNILAMLVLSGCFSRFWRRGLLLFAMFWVLVNGTVLWRFTMDNLNGDLPFRKHVHTLQLLKTRAFLETGNTEELISKSRYDIPHTNAEAYGKLLQDPFILSILPRSLNYAAAISGRPKAVLSTAAAFLVGASLPLLISGLLLMTGMIVCTIIYHFTGRFVHDQEDAGKRFIGTDRF